MEIWPRFDLQTHPTPYEKLFGNERFRPNADLRPARHEPGHCRPWFSQVLLTLIFRVAEITKLLLTLIFPVIADIDFPSYCWPWFFLFLPTLIFQAIADIDFSCYCWHWFSKILLTLIFGVIADIDFPSYCWPWFFVLLLTLIYFPTFSNVPMHTGFNLLIRAISSR